jgi:hypothetical protein
MVPRLACCKGLITWSPTLSLASSATSSPSNRARVITAASSTSLLSHRRNSNDRSIRFCRGWSRMSSSSSSSSKNQHNKFRGGIHDGENPFTVLGIPQTSSYDQVKRRFLELALQHHPDLAKKNSSSRSNNKMNDDDSTCSSTAPCSDADTFIRLRQAFEAVKENSSGSASLRRSNDEAWTDEEFQAWFHEETGHGDVMFKMDLKTRKEVIDVAAQQSQGGLDRGGMWAMARSMAEQDQALLHQKAEFKRTVGLTKSSSPTESIEPSVRRRRRT